MSRAKAVNNVATILMPIFRRISKYQVGQAVGQSARSIVRAPSGQRYSLDQDVVKRIQQAVRLLAPFLDYYPLEKCGDKLRDIVVGEKDAGTAIQQAQACMKSKILQFLDTFENQSEWEILFTVRGIDSSETNFSVGSCNFYLMDGTQFNLWGQRWFSNQYNPPNNAPVPVEWIRDEGALRGQTVASVRIHAADNDHALTKGRNRIEEALNVLRYGQLVLNAPEQPFPQIGLRVNQWQQQHSLAMRLDAQAFTSNRTLGGLEGNIINITRQSPGWSGWNHLIGTDLSNRSELGVRLSTALQWIGQAALAPAASVRIVALVTALEAILIDDGEILGKKNKLSSRISKLLGQTEEEKSNIRFQVVGLYDTRSECVHKGLIDVEKNEVDLAVNILAKTVDAILCQAPFNTMNSLSDLVEHIEGPIPASDRMRWISENAYLRFRDEVDNPSDDRSLRHWLDAEREYNSQRLQPNSEVDSTSEDN